MKTRSDYEFELCTLLDEIEKDPYNKEEYANKIKRLVPNWMETLPGGDFV